MDMMGGGGRAQGFFGKLLPAHSSLKGEAGARSITSAAQAD
jgi:hypothetical protein